VHLNFNFSPSHALGGEVWRAKQIKNRRILVNADEAVVQGGKTINYADKLISGMPKNF
jgi:hypothetical protein